MPHLASRWCLSCLMFLMCVIAALLAASPAPASPQLNPWTTLVLHAVPHDPTNHCYTPQDQGFDCSESNPANVSVTPWSDVDIYLYVRNYDDLQGVQCAFEWPLEWSLRYWWPGSLAGCQSQQILGASPGSRGGPTDGTLAAAFDCVTHGFMAPVGYLSFTVGPSGCLSIVDSSYPYGTHVISCNLEATPLDPTGWGRVCAGSGGIDACAALEAVEPTTWGRLKSLYRQRSPR